MCTCSETGRPKVSYKNHGAAALMQQPQGPWIARFLATHPIGQRSLSTLVIMALLSFTLFSALALYLSPVASAPASEAVVATAEPIVTVKNGSYAGIHSPEFKQDFFLGMPYAKVTRPRTPSLSHTSSSVWLKSLLLVASGHANHRATGIDIQMLLIYRNR
jgi:hypothetical protein